MANMNPAVRNAILKNINNYEPTKIYEWLDTKLFTLKQLIDANIELSTLEGIPDSSYQNLIQDAIQDEEITIEELKDYGLSASALGIIDESNHGLEEEPLTEEVVSELSPEDELLVWEINNNAITIERIKEKLLNGEVNENILFNHTIINNKEMINRILNYKKILFDWPEPDEVPSLPSGHTDIYFFGWSASGKSCLIASLFAYCDRYGLNKLTSLFGFGDNYKSHLIERLYEGYLPEGTPTGYINYMPFLLRNPENRKRNHPLNVVEMAGELFKDAASNNLEDLRRAFEFLKNKNRKALYFVIDYSLGGRSQDQALQKMFAKLQSENIFDKTDVIYLVVTKIDLREDQSIAPDKEAMNYLEKNYKSFLEGCRDCKDDFQIPIRVFPFSIGSTVSDILIETNPEENHNLDKYPKALINSLIDDTAQVKKSFWS